MTLNMMTPGVFTGDHGIGTPGNRDPDARRFNLQL
jgi:hypothetical protein